MKRLTLFLTAAFFLSIIISCNKDDNNDNSISAKDKSFLITAEYANRAEVEMAQLALSKSSNDSIIAFASDMVTDHTKGLSGVDSLARQYSVTLPTTVDSMHAAVKAQLSMLSGNTFDSAYISGQVSDHANTINLYQDEASNGNKQNIKDYANRNLPILRFHLQFADSVKAHLP